MYKQRRDRFIEKMNGGVAIFRSSPELIRNNDSHYKYRPDSDFYYLTGFAEPDCVMVLAPEHPEHKFILFVRPKDPERETWDGRRAGLEGSVQLFGADIAYSINELDEKLPEYLKNVDKLYYTLGKTPDFDQKIINLLVHFRNKVRSGDFGPSTVIETGKILHEMRLIKNDEELETIRKANYITRQAHIEAMKSVKPGLYEYELEAIVENTFKKHGAYAPSFNTIVGSGVNSTILHYVENDKKLEDGDLVLIDAGAEYGFYAGDISRTFPVNGKFTKPQREVYEIVLNAQLEAIKMIKPGTKFIDVHNRAIEVLTQGMIKLGLLQGDLNELIKEEKYKKFYMHKTSHWMGMDVHDVGKYYLNNESRPLEPGMILTVEPGLYIQENIEGIPPEYIGIGIRIEDDVLVTTNGNEVLSESLPKKIDEIESLIKK
jgi:Xaa-Pro aminopeptidase